MKLSQIKRILNTIKILKIQLPNGDFVPPHFHVTEVGLLTKNFIDCGGIIRTESAVNIQLWHTNDFEHRLKPKSLLDIITLSEKSLAISDFEIEVEYQHSTIGKYALEFDGESFVLINKQTTCLAQDKCKTAVQIQIPTNQYNEPCCTTDGNCC